MKLIWSLAALISCGTLLSAAPHLRPASATVGNKLQAPVAVRLEEQAPDEGLDITIRSSDPTRLRVSKTPDQPGAASVTVRVRQGYDESPEFWLQGLASSGTVSYTAEAPGYESAVATVTLAPSAILVVGPFKVPKFMTTTGAGPSRITTYAARLDSALKFVEEQAVAVPVQVELRGSNPRAGRLQESLTIPAGRSSVQLQFQPLAEGESTISMSPPPGFELPAQFASVTASVRKPGIALSDQLVIGENLQVGGVLSLGEVAPEGGARITLTSEDKNRLLLSKSENEVGSESITITVPPNESGARYYIQALAGSGTLSYTATAPGFRTRTAVVTLAPSGVIITPASQGPPDEAQVLRREAPDGVHRFSVDLSKPGAVALVAWTAQLDPVTHRSADITVQPLRAGMSLKLRLKNINPSVGQVESDLSIPGGSDHALTQFKPLTVGSTQITIETPEGFTPSANATTVVGYVR